MILIAKPVVKLSEFTLARFVVRARRAVNLQGKVNVLLTDNRAMRELNRRFRKKDKPTDVLSFPSSSLLSSPMPSRSQSSRKTATVAAAKARSAAFAGDLAISVDIASENAEQLGHPVATEIKILVLHGLLHLAGYDHEQDKGEMARQELRLRRWFKLPQSLIERTRATPTRRLHAKAGKVTARMES